MMKICATAQHATDSQNSPSAKESRMVLTTIEEILNLTFRAQTVNRLTCGE
jgi:hypothetical protein